MKESGATDKELRVVVRIFRHLLIVVEGANTDIHLKVASFAAIGIVFAKFRSIMKIAPRCVRNRDTPLEISCLP